MWRNYVTELQVCMEFLRNWFQMVVYLISIIKLLAQHDLFNGPRKRNWGSATYVKFGLLVKVQEWTHDMCLNYDCSFFGLVQNVRIIRLTYETYLWLEVSVFINENCSIWQPWWTKDFTKLCLVKILTAGLWFKVVVKCKTWLKMYSTWCNCKIA